MTGLATDSRDRVLEEIRSGERFLLITHEHPDGDAIGSLVAMQGILRALGKDSLMFVAGDDLPLPQEYRWVDLDGMVSDAPADADERTVIFLDCGNIDRAPICAERTGEARVLNLDHHHDNTHFGDVDHVVPEASCTAEIVWDLMHELGVRPTKAIAEALYVGLVTDTGRFMYENTGPRAHLMAADLIEAGVETDVIYRRLYEGMPAAKIDLLGRALSHVRRFDDGRMTITTLRRKDFDETGANDSLSEGVVDHLRSIAGTKVAVFIRHLSSDDGRKKTSLRSTDGEVDVSAIAREAGGGGHRQAAGFTTEMSEDEVIAFVREQIAAQLG
jgi:phosphoesterase RecJ-like protein